MSDLEARVAGLESVVKDLMDLVQELVRRQEQPSVQRWVEGMKSRVRENRT